METKFGQIGNLTIIEYPYLANSIRTVVRTSNTHAASNLAVAHAGTDIWICNPTAEPLILDCATEIEFAETGIFWITPIIRGRMGENIVSTTNQRPVVVKGQFAQLA